MSADLLARAVARLREVAENATPGPWNIGGDYGLSSGHVWTEVSGYQRSVGFSTGQGEDADKDAEYITTMHPPVALAVADWIDGHARDLAMSGRLSSCDSPGDVAQAMTVAAAVLGEPAPAVIRA